MTEMQPTTPPKTVAILGPGGVGGLVGALIARAGHRVVFLAGPSTAEALRADGMSVTSTLFGDFAVPVAADTVLREPVDLCVVAVKHTALLAALDRVPAKLVSDGLVLPLLNGVEHVDALRQVFDPASVAAGVIRVESTRTAPGRIVHGSPFARVDLASRTAPPARVDSAAAILREAGLTTRTRDDEQATLWDKLTVLAPFALLTTRYRAPIGDVRTAHHDELVELVTEVAAVGRASGGAVTPEAALSFSEAFPPEARSSMQRDAEAGRPIELDAIGGAVLRAARQHGMAAPATARLVAHLA